MDYALDMRNFHEGSHSVKLVPILVATKAQDREPALDVSEGELYTPICCNSDNLNDVIKTISEENIGEFY